MARGENYDLKMYHASAHNQNHCRRLLLTDKHLSTIINKKKIKLNHRFPLRGLFIRVKVMHTILLRYTVWLINRSNKIENILD